MQALEQHVSTEYQGVFSTGVGTLAGVFTSLLARIAGVPSGMPHQTCLTAVLS